MGRVRLYSQFPFNHVFMKPDTYFTWAVITGSIIFIVVWIYAMVSWGFLIGITIGWIPGLIAGVIGGFLWPVAVLVLIGFVLVVVGSS